MTDYRARLLNNDDVRQVARRLRAYFGVQDCCYVDVLACMKRGELLTHRGVQRLNYQVRPDNEMGINDGSTTFGRGVVTISVKQSVHETALLGVGRSRNTLAHELGHGVMHHGPEMYRRMTASNTSKHILLFESAEHQAKVFAAAFLINDAEAVKLSSAEEISIQFGISFESATIYFSHLTKERERPKDAERMREKARQIAADFRASTSHNDSYMDDACIFCGRQTVVPIGVKFLCTNCDAVYDRFQDGDP
jgi:hypothetical protein